MTLEDVAIWYALVVRHRDERRHLHLRPHDRQVHASAPSRLMPIAPAISLVAGGAALYRLRVGCRSGRWPLLLLIGPTLLNYFYLSSAVTLVQQEVRAAAARDVGRVAAAGDEPDRAWGLGPPMSAPPAIFSAPTIQTTRCRSRSTRCCAFLLMATSGCFISGRALTSRTRRPQNRSSRMMLSLRVVGPASQAAIALTLAACAGAARARRDQRVPVIDAPAGAVAARYRRRPSGIQGHSLTPSRPSVTRDGNHQRPCRAGAKRAHDNRLSALPASSRNRNHAPHVYSQTSVR